MIDEIEVHYRADGWLFASWRNAYILDWRGGIDYAPLDASVRGARTLLGHYPRGIVTINILHPPMRLPPPDVREYAQKKMLESPSGVLCHATALAGHGFWAAAFRAAMNGIYMFQRTTFPRKVFGELDEAVKWCDELLNAGSSWQAEVLEAVRHVMEQCEASLPAEASATPA